MTSMIHKNPEARRKRRARYIEAIEPFRQKYQCTAAQVFDIVQGIESKNRNQEKKIEDLNELVNAKKLVDGVIAAQLETLMATEPQITNEHLQPIVEALKKARDA